MRIVFIGPCTAKKLEASRRTIRSDVDFVLTFEEMQGIFDAKGIVPSEMPVDPEEEFSTGTSLGRGFAVTGGVANAVKEAIKEIDPDREVKIEHADGLRECRKMLMMAKAGKYNGYLLEGMGCPGGCVNGGGQPQQPGYIRNTVDIRGLRAKVLYDSDEANTIRKSHENTAIKELYATYLGEPGSEKAHHLLHTSYVKRSINQH